MSLQPLSNYLAPAKVKAKPATKCHSDTTCKGDASRPSKTRLSWCAAALTLRTSSLRPSSSPCTTSSANPPDTAPHSTNWTRPSSSLSSKRLLGNRCGTNLNFLSQSPPSAHEFRPMTWTRSQRTRSPASSKLAPTTLINTQCQLLTSSRKASDASPISASLSPFPLSPSSLKRANFKLSQWRDLLKACNPYNRAVPANWMTILLLDKN